MIDLPDTRLDEQKVIGTMLAHPWSWDKAASLEPADFMNPNHGRIWQAISEIKGGSQDVHEMSVADHMRADGSLKKLEGGAEYFQVCLSHQGMPWNIERDAEAIRANGLRWRLLLALNDASSRARDKDNDPLEVIGELRATLGRLTSVVGGPIPASIGIPAAMRAIEDRVKARADGKRILGARTGVAALDEHVGGLQDGWLVVIAAETGGGKTALAMQTALEVVLRGGTALACNLEMESRELFERALSNRGDTNSNGIRIGVITQQDWDNLEPAAAALGATRLYVEDAATTMAKVSATARRWRGHHTDIPGLLVVDFLQLIRSERDRGTTRAQEVGQFAQEFKALAKELRVPVILVSQLNRAGVKSGQQPSRLDLKESGDIENAADLILLPWNKSATGGDGEVVIIVDKFRNGQRRPISANWTGSRYKFE